MDAVAPTAERRMIMATCNICKNAGTPSYKSPCSECKGFSKYEYKKPQTNADRLRAMSDEELADWLARTQIDNVAEALAIARISFEQPCGMKDEVKKECLEWLKQPAEPECNGADADGCPLRREIMKSD